MIARIYYRRATGRGDTRDFTRTANAGSPVSRKTALGQPRVWPPLGGDVRLRKTVMILVVTYRMVMR
jgi:hypothetical protein